MVRVQPGHWVTERMISHSTYDESLLLLKGEMELHMDNSVYTCLLYTSTLIFQGKPRIVLDMLKTYLKYI